MIVSIIFFLFIRIESPIWRVVFRLLLIPVIAGVSFEFIRLAGKSENKLVIFIKTGYDAAEAYNKGAGCFHGRSSNRIGRGCV